MKKKCISKYWINLSMIKKRLKLAVPFQTSVTAKDASWSCDLVEIHY